MLKTVNFSHPPTPRAKTRLIPGKAAGDSNPEAYPLGYVEDFDEPRTKLGAIFSSAYRTFTT